MRGQDTSFQLPHGCRWVELPKIADERGCLAFGEAERHVPFPIKRVFWTFNVRGDGMRGDHAHRTCHMVLFPIGGCFDLELNDGSHTILLHMDDPSRGILIPPLVWCRLTHFEPSAACISLASEEYRAEDYIHNFEEFKRILNKE